MFSRSIFSMVEAWLSYLRDEYLPLRYAAGVFPSDPEKAECFKSLFDATNSYEWQLNESGTGEKKKRKTSFKPYMKACIRMMYMLHGRSDVDALFASARWHALVRSVRLRDGLMHPHVLDDINVSFEAFSDLSSALELITEMLEFTTEHALAESERLQRETERIQERTAELIELAAKSHKQAMVYDALSHEILEQKPYIHAIIVQEGDSATGRLIKVHPSNGAKAVTQDIEVIVCDGPHKTQFILRTPDAPRLSEL